jgi:hypothetical protein
MREIKFRVWEPKVRAMTLLAHTDVSEALINYGKGEDVLMQFTGLKDKTGKEIYEGDILKAANGYTIGAVEPLRPNEGYYTNKGYSLLHADHLEVIGNIYQDPKLVK